MALLAAFTAALSIVFWPEGTDQPAVRYTVTCPKAAVCAKLARAGRAAFAPVPKGIVCTDIYGGPQEALVTGRIDGERVYTRFKRTNGCETARWQRLAFLFHA